MNLLMTKSFNGVALDCYKADNEQDGFWATREQIGQLLEYEQPDVSIRNIHNRKADRLNKFSTRINLIRVEGDRTVTREVTVYNFKGFLEICRFSNQPKADAVMDFVWNIMDEIRRTGFYATPKKVEEILGDPDSFIRVLTAYKEEKARADALTAQAEENRPKVIFADAVDASKDSILIGNLAKLLNQNGIDVGQNRLFAWLREHGYLIACKGERWNFPKQCYVDQGLFQLKKSIVNNPDGTTKVTHTTKVTGKGQIYFINGFLEGRFVI